MDLLSHSHSYRERQEIFLVAGLSTTNRYVNDIQLDCPYKEQCKVTNCRSRIKEMIENKLYS